MCCKPNPTHIGKPGDIQNCISLITYNIKMFKIMFFAICIDDYLVFVLFVLLVVIEGEI